MGNIYEGGEGDARQSEGQEVTLFRTRYRQLSEDEIALHDAIKGTADDLAAQFAKIDTTTRGPLPHPSEDIIGATALNRGANVTLALRHLEDAVYRAVKALTG